MGVFVFAVLIGERFFNDPSLCTATQFFFKMCNVSLGNVKDIIAQASHNKDEYMAKFDQVSEIILCSWLESVPGQLLSLSNRSVSTCMRWEFRSRR